MEIYSHFNSKLFFDLYSRYCLTKIRVIELDKVFLQIPVKVFTEEDLRLIDNFLLIEWLALQKPFLKKINFISSRGKTYMQVLLFCTIRHKKALNTFLFLLISFTKLQEKLLSLQLNFKDNSCFFQIKDYDCFFVYPKYLKLINFLNIRLFFVQSCFLHLLGFNFLKVLFYRDLWFYNFELKYCRVRWII